METLSAPVSVPKAIRQLTWNLPDELTGRDKLLEKLEAKLLSGIRMPCLVLTGAPGVGKTALAATLACRDPVKARFSNVLFAGVGPDANVHAERGHSAAELGI